MVHRCIWTHLNPLPMDSELILFFFLLEAYTCETFLFLYIYRDPTNTISEILHRNSRSEVNNMDAAKKPIDVVDTKPFVEYVSSINIIYSNFGTLSGFVHFRFS